MVLSHRVTVNRVGSSGQQVWSKQAMSEHGRSLPPLLIRARLLKMAIETSRQYQPSNNKGWLTYPSGCTPFFSSEEWHCALTVFAEIFRYVRAQPRRVLQHESVISRNEYWRKTRGELDTLGWGRGKQCVARSL